MSAPTLKPLSKGKCLQDLKIHFDKEFVNKNISNLCKSAPKLLKAAKDADREGRQEESYILFMRYLNVISYVQRSKEFKEKKIETDACLSARAMRDALESAEKLSQSLEKRYNEKKSKAKAKTETNSSETKSVAEVEKRVVEISSPTPIPPSVNNKSQESLSSMELYKILLDNSSNVLVMDVRSSKEFNESHIKFDCCISVPEEILQPGCSAAKLAEKLPQESKSKWNRRLEVEYLVLMDWFSAANNLKVDSPLDRLRTIILKWDPAVVYRSKPVILEGGFDDWLGHYPMYCSNSKPQLPPIQAFDELLHIDDVNYPDLIDETPKFSRATKPSAKESIISSNGFSEVNGTRPISNSKEEFRKEDMTEPHSKVSSTKEKITPLGVKEQPPQILPSTPNVDRSSKIAALQRYKELEERRAKVVQYSKDLGRDREAAETELKFLQNQQGRNQLSEKEKADLYQNQVSLKLRIQELQKTQHAKDKENDLLRKELEEYKKREQELGNESFKSIGIPVSHSGDIKSSSEMEKPIAGNLRGNPSTPIAAKNTDLSIPSTGSGLKRSRSSPNIAQLVQEPEPKPSLPHFDRNTKPVVRKPQVSEFINRHRNFHEVYGNVNPGITGLKNLGNSCYMNSILQCISNINILSYYFCSGKYKEDLNRSPLNPTRGEVAEEVAHVIRNLWLGQYRSIACRDLKAVIGKHMAQFRGCGQQDAHEFLTFLMDWLHNDLKVQKEFVKEVPSFSSGKKNAEVDAVTGAFNAWNDFRSKHESFMLTAFFIQQVSTVQCSSCHVKSMNFEEPTSNLTLLLPSAARCSLSECLRLYTSKERILGYKCESCHGLHDAEKSIDLCRLPPILIFHLKRFYSDGFYQKRQTFVDFPLENLDMKNYTPNRHQSHTVYDLCGVSNHFGTLEGGHYTAYCKNGVRWYKFDDQDVSEISPEDVRSSNAYILFYAAKK